MTVKYSRKFKNELMGGRPARSLLEDCILYLHGGTPPTNPEDLRSGTQYCKVTTSHGAVASTDRSTARIYNLTFTGHVTGQTNIVNVTIDGATTPYTYTNLAEDDDDNKVAIKIARMLHDVAGLVAIPETDAASLWVMCAIKGLALTLANGGGDVTITCTSKQAAARVNSLQFGAPSAGVISMESGAVWEGVNLASGTIGYFTLAWPSDPLTADSGYAYPRVQGTATAVGGDVTIDPATVVISATTSVTSFTLTLPTS